MKKILIIFLFLSMCLISPACAGSYTVGSNLYGISNVITEPDNNYIFMTQGYSATKIDMYGTESESGIFNTTNIIYDIYVTEDYYYYVVSGGGVYRSDMTEYVDFGLTYHGEITDDTIMLSSVSGTNYKSRIIVDDTGNVFVSGGSAIYRIDASTHTSYTYFTSSYPINSFAFYPDSDMHLIIVDYIVNTDVIRIPTSTTTSDSYTISSSGSADLGTVFSLSDGSIVLVNCYNMGYYYFQVMQSYSNWTTDYIDVATSLQQIDYYYSGTGNPYDTYNPDMSVSDNGFIFVTDVISSSVKKIHTYETLENVGGYDFYPTSGDLSTNSNASITWTESSYTTGDTANITFSVENPDYDGYDYTVKIHDTVSLKQTYEVESVDNNSVLYSFSPSATSSTYLAQLIAIDSTTGETDVLAMDTTSFTASEDTYSLEFDDSTYRIGDTMKIYYSDLPTGSSIYLRGTDSSSVTVFSNTWSVSGTSYISLTVPSNTVESYTAYALYDGYILDYDVAEIIQSESEVSVYGVVYDAKTGATIENAHILINGSGPYSNEIGRYSYIIDAGTYTLACSATGYQTQYYSSVSFLTDTNRPFYMVPTSSSSTSSTASLYGAVRDYETGESLENAMITVTNSSFTKTTFTSSTGYYEVSGLLNNSSYSVYASLDGYDNYYNASVEVIDLTWLEFSLVDEDYSLGSGSDSTTIETERPGRAAAKETLDDLEEVVPGLVMFVVFFVFMNVAKKG